MMMDQDQEVEEVSFLPGDTILHKKAVYEPSKSQRFRQVACSKAVAVGILVAMAMLMLAIALIAAFARPASLSPSCSTAVSSAKHEDVAPAKTYISTKGKVFPWQQLRLPPHILPEAYDIALHPNLTESWFKGKVAMHLHVLKKTDFVVFHSAKLTISRVELKSSSGKTQTLHFLEYPENAQVYVKLPGVFPKGQKFQVVVSFNGSFSDLSEMSGFYKSAYTVEDETRYMASTQFEATFARHAFPCFDEPAMKANFTLAIVREGRHITLFNTQLVESTPYKGGLVLDEYEASPKMSSYLVAFIVCDFKNISSVTQGGVQVRMFAPEDKIQMGAYALQAAVTVLDYYNDFFSLPYPMAKLDLIAIPNFAAGAMENWGLVTFRDTDVLYNPAKDSGSNKERVAVVVAHELAHQWFGNFVTMKWWDDLWLNEGFASFIEFLGVDQVDYTFRMMDKFSHTMITALYRDSFTSSHPIQVTVHDPEEVESVFDSISYDKGASLIRMLQEVLGEDEFKVGLSDYLKQHKYSNAETQDLWGALQQVSALPPGLTVAKVMNSWTQQMNYPVVTVSRSHGHKGRLHLTQERFLQTGQVSLAPTSPFNYTWYIPFTYSTSSSGPEAAVVWMQRGGATVDLPDLGVTWVKGNSGGKGYYRVNYCEEGWQAIIAQLKLDHTVFSVLDRVSLVSDVFALARSGHVGYDVAFDLSTYLKNERDYFVWVAAEQTLSFVKGRMELDEDYGALSDYIFSLAKPNYDLLGWSTSGGHIEGKMRSFIISMALRSEYPPAVDKALGLFRDWMEDKPFTVINDLRSSIYTTGVKYGNTSDWEAVFGRYQREKTPSEKRTLLHTLSASRDARILQMWLERSLDVRVVKSQDTGDVIQYVARNPNGQLMAWRFFRQHWSTMFSRYGSKSFMLSGILKGVTGSFNTQFDYDEIKTFFQDKDMGTAALALQQSLEIVADHVTWMDSNLAIVKAWLKDNAPLTIL